MTLSHHCLIVDVPDVRRAGEFGHSTLAVTDVKSTSGMGLDLEHSDSHLVHV